MSPIVKNVLSPLAATLMQGVKLTPAERAEVLRIAQAYACKDSAAAQGISEATIRDRRRRIYRRLRMDGPDELISTLLARSLSALAARPPSTETGATGVTF
jgi:DNA-binding CsgD family transcriptional regulator